MKKVFVLLMYMALAPAMAHAQNADWKKTWDETLAAARREGKVVVSGPPSAELRQALPPAFKQRYGIAIEYIGNRSSETAVRLRAERQAGMQTVDVMIAGIQTLATILYREKMLDPLRPALILPEVVDGSNWKKGKLWFSDPEDQYVLRLSSSISTIFHINNNQVKPGELVSIRDLLNPKWKGKIAMQDPSTPGSGSNAAAALYVQFGEDFIKRLYIDQKPMINRDTRQITDALARGTHPITVGAEDADVEQLHKEGIPIGRLTTLTDLPANISAGFGLLALLNQAPHPNAAKIFANWLASKEGSEVYARAMVDPMTRNDVDESFLQKEKIPRPGVEYFDTYEWNFTVTKKEEIRLRLKELLGH